MQTKILSLYKPEEKSKQLFLTVLQEYIAQEVVEQKLTDSTQRKYWQYYRRISEYLQFTGNTEIKLSEFRIVTAEKMRSYLLTNLKCGISHASRHVELCKRAMSYAVKMEYTLNNTLEPIRAKRDKTKEVVFLEREEINALAALNLKGRLFNRVRDMYLFQCYTGLSFVDLWSIKIEIKDGSEWILSERLKNGNPYFVPLFPQAKDILLKYESGFPFTANQVYNRVLKEVANAAGITKHLTTHTGRKTFATIMDQEGVSTKTIADMMGNTLQVLQKHYLAKSSRRIENELGNLNLIPKKTDFNVSNICAPCSFVGMQTASR